VSLSLAHLRLPIFFSDDRLMKEGIFVELPYQAVSRHAKIAHTAPYAHMTCRQTPHTGCGADFLGFGRGQ
jgi:hypothetical protein